MSNQEFHIRDKVEWKYGGNIIEGEVIEKLTQETDIKGHHVKASEENPQYRVKSDKTGKEAAHKPESLTRIDN